MTGNITFAFPGRLDLNTGGYAYDRRLIADLAAYGWHVGLMPLGEGFPSPDADVLADAERRLSALPDQSLVIIDGLAFGVLDDWSAREARRLKIIALVHHTLALEAGLGEHERVSFHNREKSALSGARQVIVTSPSTAREVRDHYGISGGKITVALPGTDPGERALATERTEPPLILSVGTLIRRKGHDVLLAALKLVEDMDWRAEIVGSKALDPHTADALAEQVSALGLTDRVILRGETLNVREHMSQAHIFALASRYEGFGMVFAEALSHGLPIVACDAGAVPDVVPGDAGILVPVDDPVAFANALRQLLGNPEDLASRAEAAWRAGQRLNRWTQTAEVVANVLEDV